MTLSIIAVHTHDQYMLAYLFFCLEDYRFYNGNDSEEATDDDVIDGAEAECYSSVSILGTSIFVLGQVFSILS